MSLILAKKPVFSGENMQYLFITLVFIATQQITALQVDCAFPLSEEQQKIAKKLSAAPELTQDAYADMREKCTEYHGKPQIISNIPVRINSQDKKKDRENEWKKEITSEPTIKITRKSDLKPTIPFAPKKRNGK